MDRNETGPELLEGDIADLEAFARSGHTIPACTRFRVKINGQFFIISQRYVTAAKILEVAELGSVDKYTVRVKLAGHRPRKLEGDEKVDLRHPGIERFKALPRDQTEG